MCAALRDEGVTTVKTLLSIVVTLVALLSLSACNTIEGIGKDISRAGDKIEETAKKSK
jgi:predicted small secreted protein